MPINGYLGGVISATAPSVTTAGASGVFTLEEQLQAAGQNNWPGYQISRSVRLRSSASAYFNRTPSSASNRQTWTWSGWVKRGVLGSQCDLFCGDSSTTISEINIGNDDTLKFWQSGTTLARQSTAVFRDPSAWYHIVVVLDTTNATAQNRCRMYVNGVEITTWTTNNTITQNSQFGINTATAHNLGRSTAASIYFDGQMTEINFIDGQALTPASFGAFDAVTGVWNPIRYTGTYGNNGFYLNYSDNSAATATTIGKDYSGNGNNWTPNNISVTAGTTYDSMVDVPIGYGSDTGVGGELRGNYATFNPLDVSTGSTAQTITQANLTLFSSSATRIDGAYSTFSVKSGKWYVEMTLTTRTNDYPGVGWSSTSFNSTGSGWQYQAGTSSNPSGASIDPFGRLGLNATQSGGSYFGSGGTWAQGDIIQVAVDIDNKLIWFGKAGSWSGTAGNMNGNPATGTNGTSFSAQGGTEFKFQSTVGDNAKGDVNFGQRPFSYTAPSGFKALCTQNLPTPTVSNGANYMAAIPYSGSGASQTIANTVNGVSFQPDMVWIKSRSNATDHQVFDVVRGGTPPYRLLTNSTAAEYSTATGYVGTTSTGISLDSSGGGGGDTNVSGRTYVGWQWKAGGTAVTNTAGTITSSVSASTTAGFSVVTYTGTGANATVGHGLGIAPNMVIVKKRSAAASWAVWHSSLTLGQNMFLDSTSAAYSEPTMWNSTAPTSTVFSLGTYGSGNTSSATYVAYCFAPITGYSAFGSWQNNNSTDGAFIYLGFRPRFILLKNTDNVENWFIWDSSRQTYNVAPPSLNWLQPNTSNAEGTNSANTAEIDGLSNGFKIRTTNPASGEISFGTRTYIYAAFAENPFNISRAR